ncbi:MAG: hypothetical protein V4721_12270 [Bacteroidota bacterium]
MTALTPFDHNDIHISIIHEYQISRKSRVIYTTVILIVISGLAFLPLIHIPLKVNSTGNFDRSRNSLKSFSSVLEGRCFVSPSAIGLIKRGQKVDFKVYGFDSASWSRLTGKVSEISKDVTFDAAGQPVFQVSCRLDKDHFTLNGIKVYLKRRMKFTAKIDIGKGNLFRILRNNTTEQGIEFYSAAN